MAADPTRMAVFNAIETMALSMKSSWDSALNWAATVEALADVIISAGDTLHPDHLAVLLSTAAMARRQSLNAMAEGGEADA